MRKLKLLIPVATALLLLSCSSEEDRTNVCNCESLYAKMRVAKATYANSGGMTSAEADAKVNEEFKAEFDNCTKIREDVGEDGYFKYSQECGSK